MSDNLVSFEGITESDLDTVEKMYLALDKFLYFCQTHSKYFPNKIIKITSILLEEERIRKYHIYFSLPLSMRPILADNKIPISPRNIDSIGFASLFDSVTGNEEITIQFKIDEEVNEYDEKILPVCERLGKLTYQFESSVLEDIIRIERYLIIILAYTLYKEYGERWWQEFSRDILKIDRFCRKLTSPDFTTKKDMIKNFTFYDVLYFVKRYKNLVQKYFHLDNEEVKNFILIITNIQKLRNNLAHAPRFELDIRKENIFNLTHAQQIMGVMHKKIYENDF